MKKSGLDIKEHKINYEISASPNFDNFKSFIIDNNHPCIMAQSVFKAENLMFKSYSNLGLQANSKLLLNDIKTYLANYDFTDNQFYTFIAVFEDEEFSEIEFEQKLWNQLNLIHQQDNVDWDASVSPNPEEDNFSFSIAGRAFYVVGMHANSSRKARQSPIPAIVFNLHCQFEKLREMGVYTMVRNKIRERDKNLQGTINPMLKDFGESSEAMQYSGRQVGESWKCPFHTKK